MSTIWNFVHLGMVKIVGFIWFSEDVFNNNKCYQGRGDAFTKQKIPVFSLYVDEQNSAT